MEAKETWPALESCAHQHCEASGSEVHDHRSRLPDEFLLSSETQTAGQTSLSERNDRLSRLADDVLLSVLSPLSMAEVARTSVLSHRWKNLWRYFPVLEFENREEMDKLSRVRSTEQREKVISQEKPKFVRWVNGVVDHHLASAIDVFRVTFDLDGRCQRHVVKWVVFALTNQVKTLELNFKPVPSRTWLRNGSHCTLPLGLPNNLLGAKHPLRHLCLRYVNVTAEQIGCLLLSCPFLENLCVEGSAYLTSVRVSGSSLQLKILDVSLCNSVKTIYISAPKLLSFAYHCPRMELHIASAPLLSRVSISGFLHDPIGYIFDSSDYFSQLEHLTLRINLNKFNMRINHAPALRKLKHLGLDVSGMCGQSLLGWIPLIEASPVLEKLSFKMQCYDYATQIKITEAYGRPLKCLKMFELGGFLGRKIDLELAAYVFKNAIVLEEVVVDFKTLVSSLAYNKGAEERVIDLEKRLPPGLKLTIK